MTDGYLKQDRQIRTLLFLEITKGDSIDGIRHRAIHFQDENGTRYIYQAPPGKGGIVKNELLKRCQSLKPSVDSLRVRALYYDYESYFEIVRPRIVE